MEDSNKIERINEKIADLEKRKRGYQAKISECQDKVKRLTEQREAIRNLQISALLNEINLPYSEVMQYLKDIKEQRGDKDVKGEER